IKDECSRLLEASTMKSRRGFAIQRLMNAMRQAHADGWFIVFDTLTLADDRLEAFYDNPNALRDYFRDIGRMVLAAEGRKANDSHADCYQYFCVPEYGTASLSRNCSKYRQQLYQYHEKYQPHQKQHQ